MKRFPKLHAVDFMEFGSVLLTYITMMQQAAANNKGENPIDPALLQCPLTIQELLLLLRNVMMQCFKDTQNSVQTTYPALPPSAESNCFVPFICSTGTCFIDPVPLKLPLVFIENMRALRARPIHRAGSDYEWFIPILGKYKTDAFARADFQFAYGEDSYFSFKDPALLYQKTTGAGTARRVQMMAETSIDLIDGDSTGGYVAINSPKRLTELATLYNEWITSSGLSDYSSTLASLGTEDGVRLLESISWTRQWNFQEATADKPIQDTRIMKRKVHQTPYLTRGAIEDSSQSVIYAVAYEQVQSIWILPTWDVQTFGSSIAAQGVMGETYGQSRTSEEVGTLLADMHFNYASKLIKSKFAEESDWEISFKQFMKGGRGGILAGLAATVANGLIPGLGDVINTIF